MALTKPIKGIIGACLTPFGDDDHINYKALEKEIDFIVGDCDAITIAAVEAAEYTMLSRQERKDLLRAGTEMNAASLIADGGRGTTFVEVHTSENPVHHIV